MNECICRYIFSICGGYLLDKAWYLEGVGERGSERNLKVNKEEQKKKQPTVSHKLLCISESRLWLVSSCPSTIKVFVLLVGLGTVTNPGRFLVW